VTREYLASLASWGVNAVYMQPMFRGSEVDHTTINKCPSQSGIARYQIVNVINPDGEPILSRLPLIPLSVAFSINTRDKLKDARLVRYLVFRHLSTGFTNTPLYRILTLRRILYDQDASKTQDIRQLYHATFGTKTPLTP
jgi:hypothetical protein